MHIIFVFFAEQPPCLGIVEVKNKTLAFIIILSEGMPRGRITCLDAHGIALRQVGTYFTQALGTVVVVPHQKGMPLVGERISHLGTFVRLGPA